MEAMKDQMVAMMEAMQSMKKIMESNAAAAEVDPNHPSGVNQISRLVLAWYVIEEKHWVVQVVPMLCKARILSHHTTCLPTIHHPMLYMCLTRTSTTPLLFPLKASNPSWGMHILLNPRGRRGGREEPWDHALADFETYPEYATEGPTFGGIPQPNTSGGPHHRPLQPLYFSVGRLPPAMEEREKFDLIEERLKAIEGIGDYPFADMENCA